MNVNFKSYNQASKWTIINELWSRIRLSPFHILGVFNIKVYRGVPRLVARVHCRRLQNANTSRSDYIPEIATPPDGKATSALCLALSHLLTQPPMLSRLSTHYPVPTGGIVLPSLWPTASTTSHCHRWRWGSSGSGIVTVECVEEHTQSVGQEGCSNGQSGITGGIVAVQVRLIEIQEVCGDFHTKLLKKKTNKIFISMWNREVNFGLSS